MLKKTISAIALICLFVPAISHAQTSLNRTWLSAHVGHNEYNGDIGDEMLEYDIGTDWSFGVGFHQYLSPSFDLDITAEYGYLDYKRSGNEITPLSGGNSFGSSYVNADAMLRYKLANGYIFSEHSFIQPYLGIGVGVVPFFNSDGNVYKYSNNKTELENPIAFNVPGVVGFDFRFSPKFKIFLQAKYNRTFVDGFDGIGKNKYPNAAEASDRGDIDGIDHDDFLVTSVGIKFNVGGAKDSDGDGVYDRNDRCPQKVGSEENDGCPDSDGDGIIDKVDRCPQKVGSKENNGCPDYDGDGIIDKVDKCPQKAGPEKYDGCPDSDGDGIIDTNDKCPDVAGLKKYDGCPDSDGDGVIDNQDDCPQTPGSKENNGCPAVKKYSDVNFQFDKSFIEDQYHSELDSVATTMTKDSGWNVKLTGHADRIGPAQYNLRLSKRRAASVRKYLMDQDVKSVRITTKGVGETQPKIMNANKKERRQNRRVEINLSH